MKSDIIESNNTDLLNENATKSNETTGRQLADLIVQINNSQQSLLQIKNRSWISNTINKIKNGDTKEFADILISQNNVINGLLQLYKSMINLSNMSQTNLNKLEANFVMFIGEMDDVATNDSINDIYRITKDNIESIKKANRRNTIMLIISSLALVFAIIALIL